MQDQVQRTITVPNVHLSVNCYDWTEDFSFSVTDSESRDKVIIEGIKTPHAFHQLTSLVSGLKYHDERSRARDQEFLHSLEQAILSVRESWSAKSENTQST